ncbi:hypothetical protein FQN55_006821 [Onygenales sp. PD_40]|nr:hypothetical protein FQN55_006821 [Onygenales sp. PD_40]KAK2781066.1 hypothetical protein FQN53_000828 [Emmonsiellopsis sp. PD_33]KAK2805635.1 hypothetical protein FQN51_009138 [Onygenales sp. PD_10]
MFRPSPTHFRLLSLAFVIIAAIGFLWFEGTRKHAGSSLSRHGFRWSLDGSGSIKSSEPEHGNVHHDPVPPSSLTPSSLTHMPLFIGFSHNWDLLRQAALSYIAAGWKSSEIYIVDNTGTMDSNELGLLSRSNPAYLDYKFLRSIGVNILITPTLLTFAQLQNYYLSEAISRSWPHYFWSHQDVAVLPDIPDESKNRTFIERIKECHEQDPTTEVIWFAYDWLTYMNVEAMKRAGGWDVSIPFYKTDCDMYSRLLLHKGNIRSCPPARFFDLADSIKNPEVAFDNAIKSSRSDDKSKYHEVLAELERLAKEKGENKKGRNTWQYGHKGGKGEPFYTPAAASERYFWKMNDYGLEMYAAKWDDPDCGVDQRKTLDDIWKKIA